MFGSMVPVGRMLEQSRLLLKQIVFKIVLFGCFVTSRSMSSRFLLTMDSTYLLTLTTFRHFPDVSLKVFLLYVRTTMFSTLSYFGNWSFDAVNRIV